MNGSYGVKGEPASNVQAGKESRDQVFQLKDGWYCMVRGQTFGAWACREYATAGMRVEQRRAGLREIRNVPWTPAK